MLVRSLIYLLDGNLNKFLGNYLRNALNIRKRLKKNTKLLPFTASIMSNFRAVDKLLYLLFHLSLRSLR